MSEQAARPTAIDLDWMFCRDKVSFCSKAKAREFMLRNVARFGRQTPYKCGACQQWHLTSRYYRKRGTLSTGERNGDRPSGN